MENKIIQISVATLEDYEAISAIYNESIAAGKATMETSLKSVSDIAEWVRKFNDRERLYIVKKRLKRVAWANIKRYSNREGYRFTGETALYITKNETGKGYGKIINNFLIENCKKLNYKHIVAKIWAENSTSISLFEKMGYTIVGTQNKIGLINGEWKDVVIMQYLIE